MTSRRPGYHEAVPGHHFQIAVQMEQEGLPLFRGFPLFTAHAEGWALYTEQLAWELGLQTDPFDNLGRLQAELFRAVRLVVDTGMHARRSLGEDFDLRDFHDLVLQTGAVPLTILREVVEDWIAKKGRPASSRAAAGEPGSPVRTHGRSRSASFH